MATAVRRRNIRYSKYDTVPYEAYDGSAARQLEREAADPVHSWMSPGSRPGPEGSAAATLRDGPNRRARSLPTKNVPDSESVRDAACIGIPRIPLRAADQLPKLS